MCPPIYDFGCGGCGKVFESLIRPYDPVICPHCNCSECKRFVSAPATYRIKGDNSASTSPKTALVNEMERREGKRERVAAIHERQGIKL